MKIVELAFALLIFNFCTAAIVYSQISEYTIYYESEFIDEFQPGSDALPGNISTVSEQEQYSITMNIFDVILGVADFGWLYSLIPDEYHDDFAIYIIGLQAIVGFFYIVAIIEFFFKRTGLLGGNK